MFAASEAEKFIRAGGARQPLSAGYAFIARAVSITRLRGAL